METKLTRIAELAKTKPKIKLQTLMHVIDEKYLQECHRNMAGRRAAGIDEVTKEQYGENLGRNVALLLAKMKRQAYKPQPVKRVYIPKADGRKRPLGLPAYEDKLIQKAINEILKVIYEQEFLNCSYGFRPGRSAHDAIKEVNRIIETRKINYVVDADIKGFFDNVNHEWMIKFLKERIQDKNLLRLVSRFLKAGVMEEGSVRSTQQGTPQGGIISPTLANIYLHYILDLWFMVKIARKCRGEAHIVRYADDFVCFFQYQDEAQMFYAELKKRLGKFNLEVAESKTKIIEFGKFAEERRKERQKGKPETFDFLGFTHYCSKNRYGRFHLKRKKSRKKLSMNLKAIGIWLYRNMHTEISTLIRQLNIKLIGYYRYYGVTENYRSINNFRYRVRRKLLAILRRRSQKKSLTWEKYAVLLKHFPLAQARIFVNIYG